MGQEENLRFRPSLSAGERIRTARAERDWTQAELGKRSGISKVMIAQWETGTRKPGVDSLYTLAKTLEVSFAWLAAGEGDQTHSTSELGGGPTHNSELNKACAEMVVEFLRAHNLANEIHLMPELIEDLYGRAVQEGLDKSNRSLAAFKLAIKDLATITVRLA